MVDHTMVKRTMITVTIMYKDVMEVCSFGQVVVINGWRQKVEWLVAPVNRKIQGTYPVTSDWSHSVTKVWFVEVTIVSGGGGGRMREFGRFSFVYLAGCFTSR